MPILYALSGKDLGRSFPLESGALLGRGPQCQAVLHDASVSRQHARLELSDGIWRVRDLDSRNGIACHGRREPILELSDGDEFSLGEVLLRFRSSAGAPAVRPTPDPLAARAAPDPLAARAAPDPLAARAAPDPLAARAAPDPLAARAAPDPLAARAAPDPLAARAAPDPLAARAAPATPAKPRFETFEPEEIVLEEPGPRREPAPPRAGSALNPGPRPEPGPPQPAVRAEALDARARLLHEMRAQQSASLWSGELEQRPAWVRLLLYGAALAVAAGLCYAVFHFALALRAR